MSRAGAREGGSEWRRTTAKTQALWNLQKRSPVAANQIKEAAKRKLKTPVATRWNSLYDCVVVLLEVLSVGDQLDAITTILINQPKEGSPITEMDIQVLKEYKLVMQPVRSYWTCFRGRESPTWAPSSQPLVDKGQSGGAEPEWRPSVCQAPGEGPLYGHSRPPQPHLQGPGEHCP